MKVLNERMDDVSLLVPRNEKPIPAFFVLEYRSQILELRPFAPMIRDSQPKVQVVFFMPDMGAILAVFCELKKYFVSISHNPEVRRVFAFSGDVA